MEVPLNLTDAPIWIAVVYGGIQAIKGSMMRIERLLAAKSGQAPAFKNGDSSVYITSQTCDRCREGNTQRFDGVDSKLELLFTGQKEMQTTLASVGTSVSQSTAAFLSHLEKLSNK